MRADRSAKEKKEENLIWLRLNRMYLLTGASRMEKRPTNFDNRRGRHGNKVKQTKLPIDFINELGEKRKFGRGRYAALVSKPPIESASLIHLIISLNVTFIFFYNLVHFFCSFQNDHVRRSGLDEWDTCNGPVGDASG